MALPSTTMNHEYQISNRFASLGRTASHTQVWIYACTCMYLFFMAPSLLRSYLSASHRDVLCVVVVVVCVKWGEVRWGEASQRNRKSSGTREWDESMEWMNQSLNAMNECNEIKWNIVKWSEMKWNEVKQQKPGFGRRVRVQQSSGSGAILSVGWNQLTIQRNDQASRQGWWRAQPTEQGRRQSETEIHAIRIALSKRKQAARSQTLIDAQFVRESGS